jgi:transcription initiation factor TFIID TATA-box-binding protein
MASIQNIVSTCKISEKPLNLQKIAEKCPNTTYEPRHFNAAIIKLKTPKTTGLLFSSGRLVCTGSKNMDDNKMACENICHFIANTQVNDLVVQNIVGSGDAGKKINIIALANMYKTLVHYEPELFCGAHIRFPDSRAAALAFTSGKIVVTGLKSEAALHAFYSKIIDMLTVFLV